MLVESLEQSLEAIVESLACLLEEDPADLAVELRDSLSFNHPFNCKYESE